MCRRLGCEFPLHLPEAVVGDQTLRRRGLRALRRESAGAESGGAAPAMKGRDKSYRRQVWETVAVSGGFGIGWLIGYWVTR